MKLFYFILLFTICVVPVQAQHDTSFENRCKSIVQSILDRQMDVANKTTQLKQRLIGLSNISIFAGANFTVDSTWFRYSGMRGSKYDFSSMRYGTDYTAYGNNISYDTATVIYYASSGNKSRYFNSYNLAGLKDTAFGPYYFNGTQYLPGNGGRYSFVLNGAMLPIIAYTDVFNNTSMAWSLFSWNHYHYNNSNQLISDTSFVLNNVIYSARTYNYDIAGNLTMSIDWAPSGVALLPVDTVIFTYNAANQLKTVRKIISTQYTIDSYGYTPNIPYYTYKSATVQNRVTNISSIQSICRKYPGALGLPDSMIISDSVGNTTENNTYSYNSYGNPISYSTHSLQSLYTYKTEYYYETYNDPTSITHINRSDALTLFPSPAKMEICLQGSGIVAGSQVTIWNNLGRAVMRQTLHRNENPVLNVNTLPPGMYWLSLRNGDNTISRKFIKE